MSAALPAGFRKLTTAERREAIRARHPDITDAALGADPDMLELADVMVESAVGYFALPIGIATGFRVDGADYDVPLATEEPSVVAAASYGASVVRRGGGFTTEPGELVTTGQLFVEHAGTAAAERVREAEGRLRAQAHRLVERMEHRGGGWRGMDVAWLPATGLLRVQIHVDARDAMGANVVNSIAEALRPPVEELTGGRVVMAILSNASDRRVTAARFSVKTGTLARAGVAGPEAARRIVLANEIAREDPTRAVTHNKGIMNGITALALATGNDTRALEAAVHSYAARDGSYRALTSYRVADDRLHGSVELPLPLGTVGGATGVHPTSAAALAMLGAPDASTLARVAAGVGLAQNFAALFALVTEGIQQGHMGLHAERIAWMAGARDDERRLVVQAMRDRGRYGVDIASEELARVRSAQPGNGSS